MIERTRWGIQATEMRFLYLIAGVTRRDLMRKYASARLNVETSASLERSQVWWFGRLPHALWESSKSLPSQNDQQRPANKPRAGRSDYFTHLCHEKFAIPPTEYGPNSVLGRFLGMLEQRPHENWDKPCNYFYITTFLCTYSSKTMYVYMLLHLGLALLQ